MWSTKYTECQVCGTTSIKHKGHGLCRNCWMKDWKKKNPEKSSIIKRREYQKHRTQRLRQQKKHVMANHAKYKQYWRDWHNEKAFGGMYKQVVERDKNICLLCGSNNKIIIHHINGNRNNNKLDNLATLCRKCHPIIHYSKNRQTVINVLKEKISMG